MQLDELRHFIFTVVSAICAIIFVHCWKTDEVWKRLRYSTVRPP